MSSASGKSTITRSKTQQSKMTDFSASAAKDKEPGGNFKANMPPGERAEELAVAASAGGENIVLKAIADLDTKFSAKLDVIQTTVDEIWKEMGACNERISHAETRISNVEDDVATLQARVLSLEKDKSVLENIVTDLEARSRRSNLRLVGLPEGAEGDDPCAFLEKWIPEALGLNPPGTTLTLERAHRIGQRREANAPPRTVIMKFLNDRQKSAVWRAMRGKKQILYEDTSVRFYSDLPTAVLKQRKSFDAVRQKLRNLEIKHGLLVPTRLVVTYKDKTQTFTSPSEAENFVRSIQEEKDSG